MHSYFSQFPDSYKKNIGKGAYDVIYNSVKNLELLKEVELCPFGACEDEIVKQVAGLIPEKKHMKKFSWVHEQLQTITLPIFELTNSKYWQEPGPLIKALLDNTYQILWNSADHIEYERKLNQFEINAKKEKDEKEKANK